MSESIVIVSGARTPMGGMQGALSSLSTPELGAIAIKAAIERAGLQNSDIDEVLMGCVLQAGVGQAPARQATLKAGLPQATPAVTVNKVCGSGMQAIIFAVNQLQQGDTDIVVAGGMESMSNAPYMIPGARSGLRFGHKELLDHMQYDGLQDAYDNASMGVFAQCTADAHDVTREQMDEFAMTSLTRAQNAIKNGVLKNEIVPVTVKSRKGEIIVSDDEQPLNANIEKIPTLKPAFKKDGTITAANSSSISDGASALVLMTESTAKAKGLQPLARIVAHARNAHQPSEFTTAPVGAMEKVLKKAGWNTADVDLWEINEAFAMVPMIAIKKLGLDHAKVNVHGGGCSQGHPIGSSGSRIVVTLMHALKQYGKKRGVASLCIGGGEGLALAIEII
jgi:acetyl-CoA C-acetyltransferase